MHLCKPVRAILAAVCLSFTVSLAVSLAAVLRLLALEVFSNNLCFSTLRPSPLPKFSTAHGAFERELLLGIRELERAGVAEADLTSRAALAASAHWHATARIAALDQALIAHSAKHFAGFP